MTLVIDHRNELQDKPGLHALIVGVSAYTFLPSGSAAGTPESMGLRQLSSTALSAYQVYTWLKDHSNQLPVPLATVHLLLSPSAEEIQAEPALQGVAENATLDAFLKAAKEWRAGASTAPGNITFFYFAGHGAQRTENDAVILLENFGDGLGGPLRNSVDVGNIFSGMKASNEAPNMAQTQLYFVDACRDFLRAFRNFELDDTTQVFRVPVGGKQHRCAPIFFAAVPGSKAYALVGEQTIFSKALIACLKNDAADIVEIAGEDRWCVSVFSLIEALNMLIATLNEQLRLEQQIVLGGAFTNNTEICFLPQPPLVQVELMVEPDTVLDCIRLEVLDETSQPGPALPNPLAPHPFTTTWPAGYYTVRATVTAHPADPSLILVSRPGRVRAVRPPRYHQKVKVTP
jgi:hypothetical protein